MTLRLVFAAGVLTGILLARAFGKRQAQTAQPVDSDRFNMAELPQRVKQYDAVNRLQGKYHD